MIREFWESDDNTMPKLEIPNDGDSQPDWRLYRVNEPAVTD